MKLLFSVFLILQPSGAYGAVAKWLHFTGGTNRVCAIDADGFKCWEKGVPLAKERLPQFTLPLATFSTDSVQCVRDSLALHCWKWGAPEILDSHPEFTEISNIHVTENHACGKKSGRVSCVEHTFAPITGLATSDSLVGASFTCRFEDAAATRLLCTGRINGKEKASYAVSGLAPDVKPLIVGNSLCVQPQKPVFTGHFSCSDLTGLEEGLEGLPQHPKFSTFFRGNLSADISPIFSDTHGAFCIRSLDERTIQCGVTARAPDSKCFRRYPNETLCQNALTTIALPPTDISKPVMVGQEICLVTNTGTIRCTKAGETNQPFSVRGSITLMSYFDFSDLFLADTLGRIDELLYDRDAAVLAKAKEVLAGQPGTELFFANLLRPVLENVEIPNFRNDIPTNFLRQLTIMNLANGIKSLQDFSPDEKRAEMSVLLLITALNSHRKFLPRKDDKATLDTIVAALGEFAADPHPMEISAVGNMLKRHKTYFERMAAYPKTKTPGLMGLIVGFYLSLESS